MPVLLLLIYTIALIPFILAVICKDLAVKSEGVLAWHRDSIGELIQRFILCCLIMICMLIYEGCSHEGMDGHCIGTSLIPLSVPFCCILCKVVCLRS